MNPSAPLAIEWIDSPWLRAGRALAWTLALISVAILPIELALRVPLVLLLAAIGLVSLRRERAPQAVGCHGVAEAAALAAGGPEASLLLPKFSGAGITCAIARRRGHGR